MLLRLLNVQIVLLIVLLVVVPQIHVHLVVLLEEPKAIFIVTLYAISLLIAQQVHILVTKTVSIYARLVRLVAIHVQFLVVLLLAPFAKQLSLQITI